MDYEKEIDDYVLIQYIIMFTLSLVGKAISYDVLMNILTEKFDINYIEFRLALDNLLNADFIKTFPAGDNRQMYVITEKGIKTAELSEHDIPVYIREPIRKSIVPTLEKDKENRMARVAVRSLENDVHYADCSVFDNTDTALLKLSVFMPTREEAVEVTKRFKENPDQIYAKIISILAD